MAAGARGTREQRRHGDGQGSARPLVSALVALFTGAGIALQGYKR